MNVVAQIIVGNARFSIGRSRAKIATRANQMTRKSTDETSGKKPKIKGKVRPETNYSVFCCQGSDCSRAGAKEVLKELRREVKDSGLKRHTHIVKTECCGLCKYGPVVAVFAEQPQGVQPLVWYGKVKLKDARRIIEEHLQNGEIVEDKLLDTS